MQTSPTAPKPSTVTPRVSQSAGANLVMNSTKGNPVAVLDSGFDLTWDASKNLCKQCHRSGGQCGYNTTKAEFDLIPQPVQREITLIANQKCRHGFVMPENLSSRKAIAIGIAVAVLLIIVIIFFTICISRKRMLAFLKRDKGDEFDVEAFIRNYGSLTP
ncbi:PREDICTED: LEAF RUST 10 DISEASE-RESISTANCE LOCUS RECEPTOR-LIKE PROTEIN [Prunus dulcis]|uniref:PREDICTED: LEAF RUST 10 DISEASE-RESISTANCE LOCUS RECEPTOR-LIKE PROTEIN n=1 Tax=Prunus dulcis TaxID=3755 RepID=A0A5E4GLA3_PRUDU|nr:PREDICTED: LEAF RUST 10 DISEASE-RESISTANCE LOCUS RECEPTOR-LIKE PROTEIN [Prunus dulcis]